MQVEAGEHEDPFVLDRVEQTVVKTAQHDPANIASHLLIERPGLGRRVMDEIRRVEALMRDNPAKVLNA